MVLQATGFMANRHDLVIVAPANPAAGANLIWPVPANKVIQVVSVQINLTTSADVANRLPCLQIVLGGVERMLFSPSFVQTADSTYMHIWSMGVAPEDLTAAANIFSSPLACSFQAKPGESVQVRVINMDNTDQIFNVRIRYMDWDEGM